jgi:hypothetical protein
MAAHQAWSFADAWVFLAVGRASEYDGSLLDVISIADWINHAVLTEDELDGAVSRLSAADLVAVSEDVVIPTATGAEILRSVQQPSMWDTLTRLLSALAQLHVPEVSAGAHLPRGAYERAVAEYAARSKKLLGRDDPLKALNSAAESVRMYITFRFTADELQPEYAITWLEMAREAIEDSRTALEARYV